jgi:tetratricopeptide (TPR) repeat protein
MRLVTPASAPAFTLCIALLVPVIAATAAPTSGVLAQAAPSASASGSASAAPSEDDTRAKALAHFNKGVELMQSDSYDAAYAEFSASLALLPTKNARKNAAQCLLALKRYDEALAMYELLLSEFSAKLSCSRSSARSSRRPRPRT